MLEQTTIARCDATDCPVWVTLPTWGTQPYLTLISDGWSIVDDTSGPTKIYCPAHSDV